VVEGRRTNVQACDKLERCGGGKDVYLEGSVIRELIVVDGQDVVAKEYVRGLDLGGGIGGIIYQKKGADYYCYHYNHKGDVVALTDGNAKLAAYYEYDAWGNVMTESEKTGVDNPYRYSTKEWDEKSGLYYFGARYYSPEIGRWSQREPLRVSDALNLYSYRSCSPISRLDPDGLWDSYVHADLTESWARVAGFSEWDAALIGRVTNWMDSRMFAWRGPWNRDMRKRGHVAQAERGPAEASQGKGLPDLQRLRPWCLPARVAGLVPPRAVR